MQNNLKIDNTNIKDLLFLSLPVFYDDRGFFKENWQREKMISLGLPDFKPVQHNISFNNKKGVTRGMHAEPWDKLVSVAHGAVFACIVDLREGEKYGETFTVTLDVSKGLFIPAGCANSFQALEGNTVYSYLVSKHWRADLEYKQFNLLDAKCEWPIDLTEAIISEKDKNSPKFETLTPYKNKKVCVVGSGGQLGKAMQNVLNESEADFFNSESLDISNLENLQKINWNNYFAIINCAAYTKVDLAETEVENSYKVNVLGVENLVKISKENNLELVHISTDYVFDGTKNGEYKEDDIVNPKNIYGLHKAMSEKNVESLEKYYLIRTSWVIGEGKNFVNTMLDLASKNIHPKIVNDQVGRPTFAFDLADFIKSILQKKSYGKFLFSNSGDNVSWANFAREIFKLKNLNINVTDTSTEEYFKDKKNFAIRPKNSTFNLQKVKDLNFEIPDWKISLKKYLQNLQ
jgi:dTDP-4-dehydrorhamnose 3,5-epimerase/reductase